LNGDFISLFPGYIGTVFLAALQEEGAVNKHAEN
jgi:hypothetical protein